MDVLEDLDMLDLVELAMETASSIGPAAPIPLTSKLDASRGLLILKMRQAHTI